ncbi:hypothetical protein LJK88_22390 [Paenibacillus sp. P26]|nr:hypothetical protein LJK88_22390 [Paenibacillus sp. P26]UUZ95700.1 hypothetical protein LJK87_15480 [Paenibacillus sp. P25]
MSMKLVEMQFALHKNDEAGLKQHQLMQKPASDQSHLADAAEKQTHKERRISTKTEETGQAAIRDSGSQPGGGQGQGSSRRRKTAAETDEKPAVRSQEHPFKGRHIDLTL